MYTSHITYPSSAVSLPDTALCYFLELLPLSLLTLFLMDIFIYTYSQPYTDPLFMDTDPPWLRLSCWVISFHMFPRFPCLTIPVGPPLSSALPCLLYTADLYVSYYYVFGPTPILLIISSVVCQILDNYPFCFRLLSRALLLMNGNTKP